MPLRHFTSSSTTCEEARKAWEEVKVKRRRSTMRVVLGSIAVWDKTTWEGGKRQRFWAVLFYFYLFFRVEEVVLMVVAAAALTWV